MASEMAQMFNKIFSEGTSGDRKTIQEERLENQQREKPEIPECLTIEEIPGLDAEIIKKKNKKPNDEIVLYIHGGGFCTGDRTERREITQYIAENYDRDVISINYRLSPEHIWPTHLNDCYDVYQGLLKLGYDAEKFIFMGESAGATMVFSLALRLRDEGLALPKAIVAYSPCVNQAEGFPSHRGNAKTDTMLRDYVNSEKSKMDVFGPDHPDEKLRDPYISPYYADFKDMPPVFVSASDNEALYDDSVKMYEKLSKEGHKAGIDIQKDVFHAYPMLPIVPEARDTIEKAFAFVDTL